MKYFIYLLGIIILLALNVGLLDGFAIASAMPNLLFILLVIFALEKNSRDFFFFAVISGLFLDFYSGAYFGSYSFSFLLIGSLLHALAQNVILAEANWKYLVAFLAASLFLTDIFIWAYNLVVFRIGWSGQFFDSSLWQKQYLWELVYDLVFLYPIFRFTGLLKQIQEKLQIRRQTLK